MPLACPACRASNDAGPACRRCKADLTLCFAVEKQRERALAAARFAIAQDDFDAAFAHVRRAAALRRGTEIDEFRAVLYLLRREFASAWHEYNRTTSGAAT